MFKRFISMVKGTPKMKDVVNTKTDEPFENYIDDDNVMLSVYKDLDGLMYIVLNDKSNPKVKITITAEALYRVTGIVGEVFESRANTKVESSLN